MKPLDSKIAIITGASAPRGIGRAVALRLAADGATVIVSDRPGVRDVNGTERGNADLLRDVVSAITATGGSAIATEVDVTRQADVAACVELAMGRFGRLDILVNNAGSLAGADLFLDTTPSQWTTSFQVNLLGPMMFTQAAIPPMRQAGGGAIINIGSTGSLGAEAGFGAYTAMKHGLIGMTKTVAAEFGADGIRCNAVCPGYIATDMHQAANLRISRELGQSVAETAKQRYASVALRKAGDPGDVADAVAYLAGPQSVYVTGIALPVAGGVPFGI